MTGDCNQVEKSQNDISAKKCKSLISKIAKDETHLLDSFAHNHSTTWASKSAMV